MIRIDLGVDGLARTRFAVSPLRTASDLLYTFGTVPHALTRQWRARTGQVLAGEGLGLLAALASPTLRGYSADFINPAPAGFDNDLEPELHQVAITSAERVRYEMTIALDGHPMTDIRPRTATALLRHAAQRGEHDIAERVAAQLERFWKLAIAPSWPRIQQQIQHDIAARATLTARDGFDHMISGLHPGLAWREGGLDLDCRSTAGHVTSTALILAPSVFTNKIIYSVDPPDAPTPRPPMLCYPATGSPAAQPPLDDLIGVTRARLLQALSTRRSTGELAEHLHLARSTVSYHLQILYRAGLLHRTRHGSHILYQAIPGRPATTAMS